MAPQKQVILRAIWLFAALATVFSPALNLPDSPSPPPGTFADTIGPRMLAPASHEGVAQEDRSATRRVTDFAQAGLLPALVMLLLGSMFLAVVSSPRPEVSPVTAGSAGSRGPPAGR